ncbi:MAG TPA: poly-beta-1,6-N-acetyl-D-glucosamine biosynthesis protein PgaD [Pseudoxanthomonas sp.]|jgi:biofilm PGA synthesis protein PgaD|nr:poly-beta-1,6-N-acetyl-D-glucosamine biosynthesis protein PgaD [Pseudoxanthomonas sp.]
MKFDSRLIHKPHAQPRLKRAAWGFVTVAFWGVYIYLWLPLLTLILWLLGVRTAFFELYSRQHQVEPFLVLSIPLIAAVCACVLIAWAEYNRFRFASKDRRNPQRDVDRHAVAERLGANAALADELGQAKVVLLRMNDRAEPVSMLRLPDGAR